METKTKFSFDDGDDDVDDDDGDDDTKLMCAPKLAVKPASSTARPQNNNLQGYYSKQIAHQHSCHKILAKAGGRIDPANFSFI